MKSDNLKHFISLKTDQGYRKPDKVVGFLRRFLRTESLPKLGEVLSVRSSSQRLRAAGKNHI